MALTLAVLLWLIATSTVVIFIGRVWWYPELISEQARAIDDQSILTFIVVGIVFFLAQVALGYFIWRFRARADEPASYWHESPKLEATWTILTAIVFIGLGIQGNRVWAELRIREPPADALTIEVVPQQFAWNIRYPGPDGQLGRTEVGLISDAAGNPLGLDDTDPAARDDIVAINQMAIPEGRPIRVILRTKDVTHSFFVPQLRVKQDAVPGMAIMIHFTANKLGEYEIACAELCGMQHYKMRGRLMVMSEPDYENWLKQRSAQ